MDEASDHHGQTIEIKKYPNRRYYDTTNSRHVTLEQIFAMIRDGRFVRVSESKSGEDITVKVLAQILLEYDPPKLQAFPVDLLHRMIRANERLIHEFVEKYFSDAFAAFMHSRRDFEEQLRKTVGLAGSLPTGFDWARLWRPGGRADQKGRSSAAETDDPAHLREELTAVRQRLADLEQRLAGTGESSDTARPDASRTRTRK